MKIHFAIFLLCFSFSSTLRGQDFSWDTLRDTRNKLSGVGKITVLKIPVSAFDGVIQNTIINIKGMVGKDSVFNISLKTYFDTSGISTARRDKMKTDQFLEIPFAKLNSFYKATSVVFNFKIKKEEQGKNLIFKDTVSTSTSGPASTLRSTADNLPTILKTFSCGCPEQIKDSMKIKSLDFCPDCGDKDVYVYDANCKSLFKKTDEGYKKIENLSSLKFRYNNEVKIKIIHVNTYLNDVEITAEDSIYESEAPALFNSVFGGNSDIMAKLLDAYKNKIQSASSDSLKEFVDLVNKFTDYIDSLKEIRASVNYQCCEAAYDCGSKPNISSLPIRKLLNKIDGFHTKLSLQLTEDKKTDEKKILDEFWASFSANKPTAQQIDDLVTFYNNFSKQNYTFSTASIFPKGSRMSVIIKIKPRDTLPVFTNGLQIPVNHYMKVDGFVRNKWFVSFSSGPYVGIGEKLYAKSYEFKKLPTAGGIIADTSKTMLVESGKTPAPVGLCALANIQVKLSSYWGAGVSIGAGLTAETSPRLNYLLGGSLFFGDQRQFGLTGGATGMQANVLKKDLYPDFQIYPPAGETLKYTKDFRVGAFVSFTYTFFTMKSTLNSSNKTR